MRDLINRWLPALPSPLTAQEEPELAKLKAEVDRLGGVIIEQAIELAALRGKTSWG